MRNTTTRSWTILGLVILTLVAISWGPASQAEPQRELAARGRVTYRVYCSNCHGAAGLGDGPLAGMLKTAPPDLTKLAERNKGTFDTATVRGQVDGRNAVAAHGYSDMPVWGLSFQNLEKGGDQEADVQAKLDQLVAFLATLQTTKQ